MLSYEQLHSILSSLPDPAFILTRSGRYAALYGGTDQRYYHDGAGLVGLKMSDVLNEEKAGWFMRQITAALDSRALHVVEYTLSGSDVKGLPAEGPDHPIWFEGRVKALDFRVDGEDAVVWVASNITEKNAIQSKLREQSETDALTGLFNRRKLLEALKARHELFLADGTRTVALMFDVDNFKRINDVGGHKLGDDVLVEISRTCREDMRSVDMLSRLGGDEFVVLMPGLETGAAESIANLLRLRVAQNLGDRLGLNASISGGISEFDVFDSSGEDVLHRADDGLYESKRRGRNCISIVSPRIDRRKDVITAGNAG